jgi:hypothetical protein
VKPHHEQVKILAGAQQVVIEPWRKPQQRASLHGDLTWPEGEDTPTLDHEVQLRLKAG